AYSSLHPFPTRRSSDLLVACGAIEQKFWSGFVQAISLPSQFVDDMRDPKATRDVVARLILARSSDEWRPILAAADCCTTIVTPRSEEHTSELQSLAYLV